MLYKGADIKYFDQSYFLLLNKLKVKFSTL